MSISEGDEDSTSSSSTAPRAAKKRWPRWARIIRAVVIVAVVLILALFFVAPPIARSVLEKQLTTALSTKAVPREAHVEKVRINPLNLSVAIEGLSVTEPARNETLVAWRKLYASLDLRTLVTHEWRFRKIALDGFSGRLAVQKNNQLNIGDLFESSTTAPTTVATSAAEKNLGVPSGTGAAAPTVNGKPETINSGSEAAPAALHINTLIVTDSHLDYSDATLPKPFSTTIGPMSFTVTDFQTGGPDRAPGTFTATTDTGESLSWTGNLSVAPLFSRGELRFGNIPVKKYAPYYTRFVGFDVLDGTLDIIINYELFSQNRAFTVRASQGGLLLRSLKLAPRGTTQPMVAINSLALEQFSIESINDDDPAQSRQTIHVARAALDGGSVAFRRDANGLALVTLFTPPDAPGANATPPTPAPAPAAAPTPQPESPPVDVILDELNVQNLAVAIEDNTLGKQPLRTNVTLTSVIAKNFSLNRLDQPLDVAATLQAESGGRVSASGTMSISPFAGSYAAEWAAVQLAEGSPYVEQFIPIRITRGAFSGTATVNITASGDIAATGGAAISDFAAVDAAASTPLQSWKQLVVTSATFASGTKTQISIAEIALQGSQTQVIIQPDGVLNWAALTGGGTAATTATTGTNIIASSTTATVATSGTDDSAMLIRVRRVALTDGRVEFQDQSIQPAVTVALTAITGTIGGLSSANLERARVDISAKINDTAPVTLAGRINSLSSDKFTDLKFSLHGANLAPLAPYVEKYAGRKLASGTLHVDVTTKLAQHFLDSDNVVTLDQFAFGEKTNSPDATSLPLGLAVSLLRDTKGQIVLDVPVKGSLDDPNFKYGRAVWRAIGNILTKAATAPFNLLLSVVGGGGQKNATAGATGEAGAAEPDYSIVEFDAGASALNAAALQKLAAIAQGLNARPALHLDLTGGYDATTDKAALQKLALQKQLLAGASPGQAALTPGEENLAVQRLYQSQFATAAATTTTTAAATQTPPPSLPSQDEMRAKLLSTISVSDEQLRQLASARAQAVKDYLTSQGRVPVGQIDVSKDTAATGARVNLQLQ